MKTKHYEWDFPEDGEDPYIDRIEEFYKSIDSTVFSLHNTFGNVIIPPASTAWNGVSKIFSWSDDFEVPVMGIGFSLLIRFGPDNLTRQAQMIDGSRLVAVVPNSLAQNTVVNFQVVNSNLSIQNGLLTVGFCRGNRFYANFPTVYI